MSAAATRAVARCAAGTIGGRANYLCKWTVNLPGGASFKVDVDAAAVQGLDEDAQERYVLGIARDEDGKPVPAGSTAEPGANLSAAGVR